MFFRAHERPAADSDSSFTGVSSIDELKRQAELHKGKIINRATGQSHRAEHDTRLQPPDSTAELALCVGGTQRKVIQADIIQKLLHHVTLLPCNL